MNRPNKKDYMNIIVNPFVLGLDETAYRKDIEKYCDELEKELQFVKNVVTPDYEKVQTELQMYEKALDKASDILNEGYGEEYASFIYMKSLDERIEIPNNMTISQWKEWLLKDE